MSNVYYYPEQFGLTTIGEVEWSEPCYDFDLTVLWRDEAGKLYWASDSGCSCPSPFEDLGGLNDLSTGSAHEFAKILTDRLVEMGKSRWQASDVAYAEPKVLDLLAKVMS